MIKIFTIISLALTICSCNRPSGDLAEMAEMVLKEDQPLKIEITPGSKVK